MPPKETDSLIVFLHGVGSRSASLLPLARQWAPLLPGAEIAAPDGPAVFDGDGAGRQWFSVDGVNDANRPQRIEAARAGFDETLRKAVDEHGLLDRLDRVVLVGFSQGAIMALDAVATGRWPVAAVVAYCGRLASPTPLTPSKSTRVLLVHGAEDQVIAARHSTEAAAMLGNLGLDAQSRILPLAGHTITAEGAQLGVEFVAGALAA
ncbi:alpha/beta hydrolase [Mesorhizobium sp. ANAO-SY3R2]|uniref:alpha/beta hydrolase n=1 Tax=Mesorhizobium sp. ANAO-SY3R2 TaxID=3166644 RepID=UPI00367224E9